jgi:signal transduction histidine kinase/ActR/RegA family two-component response regulator
MRRIRMTVDNSSSGSFKAIRLDSIVDGTIDLSAIRFEDIFDIDEIQKIQDAFSDATGVASIITDVNGVPITRPSNFCRLCEQIIRKSEIGLSNCYHSDAILGRLNLSGPIMQPCLSGGLWDGGTSICIGDRHIANWLIGQVLEEPVNEETMLDYARKINVDIEEFRSALKDVTRMSREQFEKICRALYLIASQLSHLAIRNVQQSRFIVRLKEADEERSRLEEQLVQARKLESIGQLAGGIAHDFNNMLTPVLGYSEMLQDEFPADSEQYIYVDCIIKAAKSARDLVSQLLAFARKQMLTMRPIDMNTAIRDFIRILERTIREDIRIVLDLTLDSCWIEGDIRQIEQIIVNLSTNAQDAMPDGGTLTIRTSVADVDSENSESHKDVPPGQYVVLAIVDTGVGMGSDILERLFDPFFTTKEVGKGTGLGLSTVYGIVSQHSGFISVDSLPSCGSAFTIYLPRMSKAVSIPEASRENNEVRRGTETILIVEDQEQVRTMIGNMLRRQGYKIILAENGYDALEKADAFPDTIHLLVSDIVMPGINGKQLYEILSIKRPTTKALFVSGYSRDAISNRGALFAGIHLLQKPFSLYAFADKVREVIDEPKKSQ